jgi:hypothetical protein
VLTPVRLPRNLYEMHMRTHGRESREPSGLVRVAYEQPDEQPDPEVTSSGSSVDQMSAASFPASDAPAVWTWDVGPRFESESGLEIPPKRR